MADLRYHGGSILGDPTYSEEKEKRNERKDSLIWGLGGAAFGRERKITCPSLRGNRFFAMRAVSGACHIVMKV